MTQTSSSAPLFSVIVPTYERPQLLAEAIQSVLAQTVTDFECIVVDDASRVAVTVPKDRRVRLARRAQNGGPSLARNTGLALARGRYVAFLDDDDLYTPERLEIAAQGLERAPIAICWTRAPGGGPRGRMLAGDVHDSILDATTPHLGATAVIRAHAQPFDETMDALEDVEWWLRMSEDLHVWTVPRGGYVHRPPEDGHSQDELTTRIRCSIELLDREQSYFRSHPRATAFRWLRIGLMARAAGDGRLARSAFWRSMRAHPSTRSLWHLLFVVHPSEQRRVRTAALG
jgi:glycosyltransferase involved in cell wall biosynthesis